MEVPYPYQHLYLSLLITFKATIVIYVYHCIFIVDVDISFATNLEPRLEVAIMLVPIRISQCKQSPLPPRPPMFPLPPMEHPPVWCTILCFLLICCLFYTFFFFLKSRRFWAEARNPPRPETTACNISFVPSVTRTGDPRPETTVCYTFWLHKIV